MNELKEGMECDPMEEVERLIRAGKFTEALCIAEDIKAKSGEPSTDLLLCISSLHYHLGHIQRCLATLNQVNIKTFDISELILENNKIICEQEEAILCKDTSSLTKISQRFESLLERIGGLPTVPGVVDVQLAVTFNFCSMLLSPHDELKQTKAVQLLSKAILEGNGKSSFSPDDHLINTDELAGRIIDSFKLTALQGSDEKLPFCLTLCGTLLSFLWILQNKIRNAGKLLRCLIGEVQHTDEKHNQLLIQKSWISGIRIVYFLLACCQYIQGQTEEALNLLDQVIIKKDAKFPPAIYLKGLILYQDGQIDQSVVQFEQSLRSSEDDADMKAKSLNMLGCCCLKKGKPYTALQKFKEALQCSFQCLESLYNVALVYHSVQQHDVEIDTLKLLLKSLRSIKHQSGPSSHVIFQILEKNTEFTPCIVEGSGIQGNVEERNVLYHIARQCAEVNRVEESAEYYLELLVACGQDPLRNMQCSTWSLPPPPSQLYQECIKSLLHAGRYDDALTLCEKSLLSLDTSSHTKKKNMSTKKDQHEDLLIGKRGRDSPDSSKESNAQEDIVPEDVLFLLLKADALTHLHQLDMAILCLNRVIEVLEGQNGAQEETSNIEESVIQRNKRRKLDNGEVSELESSNGSCKKSISLLSQAYCNKGLILLGRGQSKDAVDLLRQSLQYLTDNTALYNYTLLLLKLSREQEACANWLKFRGYELKKDKEYYRMELRKLQSSLGCTPGCGLLPGRVSADQLNALDKAILEKQWKMLTR